MGSESITEAEAPNPTHDVELTDYCLGVFPVTNREYAVFTATMGHRRPASFSHPQFASPDHPVVGVNWHDAMSYCRWAGGTLPTEAQWELAARGFEGRRYPWGDADPDETRACFALDWNRGTTAAVGTFPLGVGPFGNHDLAGNVWEWCRDVWAPDAHVHRTTAPLDPCVSATGRVRPLRGGCWRSIDCKLQGAYRNWSHEIALHTTIGFRLCIGP
ncbi:Sulfatase modifying factor 1 precursor [Minicystis rosea]|nr:Sulfatase modifying factor 1 precursor [Minicystis rosea]